MATSSGRSTNQITTSRALTELAPNSAINHEAFLRWLPRFSANFGIDYAAIDPITKTPTGDALKMTTLYERIRRLGWSAAMFEKRAGEFLDTHRWPSWTIADFMGENAQPVSLHPHSWFIERVNEVKSNAEAIACYLDPQGRKGWGWIHELEGRLERAPQERGWKVERLPEPELPTEDLREQIDRTKLELRITKLEAEVEDLRTQKTEVERKYREARNRVEIDAATIDTYKELITELLDGELTVAELREEMAAEDPPELTPEQLLREVG